MHALRRTKCQQRVTSTARRRAALGCWLVLFVGGAGVRADDEGALTSPAPATARWLVDRARDYELTIEASPSIGDVQTMLVWLRAATRVDPGSADAWIGQFNLRRLFGQHDEASDALERYTELVPQDEPQRLLWLGESFEQLQSAEQRVEFCKTHLADEPPPAAAVASELHRWLGETYSGIGEESPAREHLQRAVEVYPFNFRARDALLAINGGHATPLQQTETLLASIASTGGRDGHHMWGAGPAAGFAVPA